MKPQPISPVPRIALTRDEAAVSLGVSLDSFERHVQPEVRMVRRGKLRLVPVGELERWASEQAGLVLSSSDRHLVIGMTDDTAPATLGRPGAPDTRH